MDLIAIYISLVGRNGCELTIILNHMLHQFVLRPDHIIYIERAEPEKIGCIQKNNRIERDCSKVVEVHFVLFFS